MRKIRQNRDRRGFVLLSAVMFILILVIIIIALIGWSVTEFSWTNRSFMTLRALNLADAGADLAAWEVIHDNQQFTGWSGSNPKTLTLYSFQDHLGETIGDVAISSDNISPNNYLVTSTAFIPSSATPTVQKRVKAKIFPHPLFNNAVFGDETLTISGSTALDSYDSSAGPYSPLTAGSSADIGSNGALIISGSADVKGDAIVGSGGTISGNDPGHMTGETFYSGNEVELEEMLLPEYFVGVPNLGNLTLGGTDSITLIPGNYVYQSISMTSKSSLTLSNSTNIYIVTNFTITGQAGVYTNGNAELYLGGNGSFSGKGLINSTGLPNDMQIYGLGDGTTLSFSGTSDFYGSIYAPEASVSISGSTKYFGAVTGENVTLSGSSEFHYDESLATN